LIHSPPIELPFIVQSKWCAWNTCLNLNKKGTMFLGKFVNLTGRSVLYAISKISKTKLSILVYSHAINGTKNA
jgi:hypothetical protein